MRIGRPKRNPVAAAPVCAAALLCAALACGSQACAQTGAQGEGRDPLRWPFSRHSIWNMPIGSAAVYVPAGMDGVPGRSGVAWMPHIDAERIVLRPNAPSTPIYHSSAGWSGKDRCDATGAVLFEAPMPPDFIVASGHGNDPAVFLARDRRTLLQAQPLARCKRSGPATSLVQADAVDIHGDGIQGAHGGSGLSAFGGSLRVGELRPGMPPPRHALKINVHARQYLHRCRTAEDCYRWPALRGDAYAIGYYGSRVVSGGQPPSAMKMGALLAIPAGLPLAMMELRTEPARMLAWTLQNYGAYIVDDTYGPGFAFSAEDGPDGSFAQQFQRDWGFAFEQKVRQNSDWVRDVQKIVRSLHVVDNNGPDSIGGGGAPRQPLAPPFRRDRGP
ncbi:hypothetical protein [Noviherbaspirillum pedocola]|uniref:Uncharacterized protein n=1 Tax=Noviherbaspirillum pedocola TaxID=2801341 RepID=A0A934T2P1_9BURK|nr:hypothetical protein [Noviherbaspirillum pedocola]MBK4738149.1 hypothetical protein [Noviherbaspirillum pedocola]